MIGAFVADEAAVADIVSMYVTPDCRRQGLARALMVAILCELSKNGTIKDVRLAVNVEQQAAIRLYENVGFRAIGTENDLMGDGHYYDGCIMEKRLD